MVDVFSRFAYSESVKSKKSTAVITAFKNIYQRAPGSVYLQTDRKAEFTNKSLEKWLKQLNITLFHTRKYDTQAAIAERLIRTLKSILWWYFKANNIFRYVDVLEDLLFSYNNSYHGTIKTAPSAASRGEQDRLWLRLYRTDGKKKHKLSENDFVRVRLTNYFLERL